MPRSHLARGYKKIDLLPERASNIHDKNSETLNLQRFQ